MGPSAADTAADRLLARLTGLRTSKPNYYPEYRRTSAGLERALAALPAISEALCMTTSGPGVLVRRVVDVAAAQFSPTLTLLALRPEAFGSPVPPLVARTADQGVITEVAALPVPARALVRGLLGSTGADADRAAGDAADAGWVVARLRRGEEVVGGLAVQGPAEPPEPGDVAILDALGNQALTAVDNACLYEQSEQLRARIAAVYDEAEHHARDLDERSAQLRSVQRHLTEAHERHLLHAERERIARELHDSVAQHLLSIGLHLEWCRPLAMGTPALEERLRLAKGLARDAVDHIREAIFSLCSPEETPRVLRDALEELAGTTEVATGTPVSVRVSGDTGRLDMGAEHGLQRIAQEAVANAARHATATRIRVAVRVETRRAVLAVTDDGTGDAAALRERLHGAGSAEGPGAARGLGNMAVRARELGGSIAVHRARGGGIALRVIVPLAAPTDEEVPAGGGPA